MGWQGRDFFSSPPCSDWLWGSVHLLFNDKIFFTPGVKQLGREADHSPPFSAEIKNAWSYTHTPQYVFVA